MRILLSAAGICLVTGCGPSSAEIGAGIALVLPLMLVTGSAVLAVFERIATARWPSSTFWGRCFTAALVLQVFGVGAAWTKGAAALDLAPVAFIVTGASWLAVAFVVWRIRLGKHLCRAEGASFGYGPLWATLFLVPSVPLGFLPKGEGADFLMMAWIYCGGFGGTPGVVLVLFALEAAFRWGARRRPQA